jgi:hypothetical protein
METNHYKLLSITVKSTLVHTVTYFLVGLLAFTFLDYSTRFSEGGLELLMRPTDHPLVMAGPLFQPLRGLLFGFAFYLLREAYFPKGNGWLRMWAVLVIMGILSPFGPAPGSIEGIIYTTLPLRSQLSPGMLEVLLQSLLLSFLVHYWVNNSQKRWLAWAFGILFALTILLPLAGLLASSLTS